MRKVLAWVVLLPLNDSSTILGRAAGTMVVSPKMDRTFTNTTIHRTLKVNEEKNNFKRIPTGEEKKRKEDP